MHTNITLEPGCMLTLVPGWGYLDGGSREEEEFAPIFVHVRSFTEQF
jgi:hypothetical protein